MVPKVGGNPPPPPPPPPPLGVVERSGWAVGQKGAVGAVKK